MEELAGAAEERKMKMKKKRSSRHTDTEGENGRGKPGVSVGEAEVSCSGKKNSMQENRWPTAPERAGRSDFKP